MSEKIFYGMIAVAFIGVGIFIGGLLQMTPEDELIEPIQQIDYSGRFDRLEAGIRNYAIDICFQWGGQFIIDQNKLFEQDFDIPLANGNFQKGKAIICVKQV